MSHFVNTNFVFSCYFSVLFSSRMPAISFHLVIVPSYLFIYHRSHIINVMQTVTGNVCVNSNKSAVTVHAYVSSNGICRGFAIKYGKFLLPPRFLTALSLPNVPACKQFQRIFISIFNKYFILCNTPNICYDKNDVVTHHNACNVTHGVY